jgi:hypothetical protein
VLAFIVLSPLPLISFCSSNWGRRFASRFARCPLASEPCLQTVDLLGVAEESLHDRTLLEIPHCLPALEVARGG